MINYYKILGVKDFASKEDIKTAYRKLSKKFHPDVNDGDEFFAEKFKEIQQAYEHLTDDFKKRKHDDQLNNHFGESNENCNAPKSNKQTNDNYNPFETEKESKKDDAKIKTSKKRIVIICLMLMATFYIVFLSNKPKDDETNNSTPIDRTATANETIKIAGPNSDINTNKTETKLTSDIKVSSDTYYSIGSSKNVVLQIQGNPTTIMNAGSMVFWYYGSSSVTFENGKVSEFSNIGQNLKIKLIDERNTTLNAEKVFTIGSSKNTVLQIQGNPTTTMNAGSTVFWYYGSSSVTFENGKISEFSNIGQNLKIKLIDERNTTLDAESVFTIGSSKNTVLQIQGNPTTTMNAGSTVFWYYGSSSVTFEDGKVSEFSNIGQNLKIKL